MPKKNQPEAPARTARARSRPRKKKPAPTPAKTRRRGPARIATRSVAGGAGETGREHPDRLKPGLRTKKTRPAPFELVKAAAKKKAVVRQRRAKGQKPAAAPGAPSVKKTKAWKPSEMLENGQWETFCQKMAMGVYSNYSCYLQAYPESSPDAARRDASRLLTNADIKARIAWIREDALKHVKITLEGQLLWYQRVMEAPVGYIDDESPLAQEVQRDEQQLGGSQGQLKRGKADSGNEMESPEVMITKVKIKIPSKMDAAKQIDKLMGFEKPQELNISLGYEPPSKALERIAGKGIDLAAILKKAGVGRE